MVSGTNTPPTDVLGTSNSWLSLVGHGWIITCGTGAYSEISVCSTSGDINNSIFTSSPRTRILMKSLSVGKRARASCGTRGN